jgi:hypothetical protein
MEDAVLNTLMTSASIILWSGSAILLMVMLLSAASDPFLLSIGCGCGVAIVLAVSVLLTYLHPLTLSFIPPRILSQEMVCLSLIPSLCLAFDCSERFDLLPSMSQIFCIVCNKSGSATPSGTHSFESTSETALVILFPLSSLLFHSFLDLLVIVIE